VEYGLGDPSHQGAEAQHCWDSLPCGIRAHHAASCRSGFIILKQQAASLVELFLSPLRRLNRGASVAVQRGNRQAVENRPAGACQRPASYGQRPRSTAGLQRPRSRLPGYDGSPVRAQILGGRDRPCRRWPTPPRRAPQPGWVLARGCRERPCHRWPTPPRRAPQPGWVRARGCRERPCRRWPTPPDGLTQLTQMIAGLSHDCSEASRTFAGEWTMSSTCMVPGTSTSELEHANVITDAEPMELCWRSATCADRRINSTCDASEHLIAPRQNHVLALCDKP